MLYEIRYFGNKERCKQANEWLKKTGSASIPCGVIEVYFVDFDVAQEVANALNEAHLDDNIEYSLYELKKLNEADVDKKLIMRSREDYRKFMDRKFSKRNRERELGL